MLQGTFETLALPELLGLLASARKTGALRLEAGPISGVVHLEDGHCRAVETAEHLGRVQDAPALLSRLVDVCFAVTRQEVGAFRFVSDEPAPWRSDEPIDLSDALVEVDRLLKQWRESLHVIPSLDCRPHLREVLDVDEVALDRDGWALLVAIDGERSVRDLVQRAARPVIEVCHSLLGLIEAGAIEILEPATAAAPPAAAAPAAPAPAAPAPAPTPPVPPPVQAAPPVAAPAPAAPAPAPPAPAPTPTAPAPPAPSSPVRQPIAASTGPAPAPNGTQAPEPRPRRPEPEQPEAEPEEKPAPDRGEAPDKGAFLRMFSGLREG
ncbi:MAG TPA: DUF4388 domain-containing protein [Acidimicrobiia bacterium]|nr:DUF4388 domain-containing protein [Acidimicrobiia bacterium]